MSLRSVGEASVYTPPANRGWVKRIRLPSMETMPCRSAASRRSSISRPWSAAVASPTSSTVGAARQAAASNTSWTAGSRLPILARTNSANVPGATSSALSVNARANSMA